MFRKRLKIVKLDDNAKLPYKDKYSAGYDLYASESTYIYKNSTSRIFTGLSINIPKGYFGLLAICNSLTLNKGLHLANSVGIIDSNCDDELVIPIHNTTSNLCLIEKGEKFAQLIILPSYRFKFRG